MALIETYTGRLVAWEDAINVVREGQGDVFALVVKEKRKTAVEKNLTYGFFLRAKTGVCYDVQMSKRHQLKTAQNANAVHTMLTAVYPDTYGFFLPNLAEENVIGIGEVEAGVERYLEQRKLISKTPKF